MPTINWRIRRIGQAIFTTWAVVTLSFLLVHSMPGSPMGAMVRQLEQQGVNPARARQIVELRLNMNPDEPMHIAYINYMQSTFQGNLGHSTYYNRPVTEILAEALPWSLFVLSWAVFIAFFIGISIGALMAYWEGSKFDTGLTTTAVVLSSIPFYVLAILLVIYLAYGSGPFPTGGRQPTGVDPGFNYEYITGVFWHAALPVFAYVVQAGVASLGMRGNAIRVLGEDYLRVARLRGLPDLTISTQYVARNAVLPMYTSLMIRIGQMFGGLVILEYIFTYRGTGWYLYQGVENRDYALMIGGFMVITIAVVAALLIADFTYSWVDPRAGGQGDEAH